MQTLSAFPEFFLVLSPFSALFFPPEVHFGYINISDQLRNWTNAFARSDCHACIKYLWGHFGVYIQQNSVGASVAFKFFFSFRALYHPRALELCRAYLHVIGFPMEVLLERIFLFIFSLYLWANGKVQCSILKSNEDNVILEILNLRWHDPARCTFNYAMRSYSFEISWKIIKVIRHSRYYITRSWNYPGLGVKNVQCLYWKSADSQ